MYNIIYILGSLVLILNDLIVAEVCKLSCPIPLRVDMKCGSNGVTYQNEQELLCAKIRCYPNLYLAQNGACTKFKPIALNQSEILSKKSKKPYYSVRNSTIGTTTQNSITDHQESKKMESGEYSNRIPLPTQKLPENSRIPQLPIGSGESSNLQLESSTESLNVTSCLDDCVCGFVLSPVCASNRVTYGNYCLFECIQKCEPQLKYHHQGFCGKIFFGYKPFPKLKFFRLFSSEVGILI